MLPCGADSDLGSCWVGGAAAEGRVASAYDPPVPRIVACAVRSASVRELIRSGSDLLAHTRSNQIPVRTVNAPGGGDHHIHSLDAIKGGLQRYDPAAEKKPRRPQSRHV